MCCLSEREILQGYRVFLEIEKLIDRNDPCFQDGNKVWVWAAYIVLASPFLHILISLMFK